MTTEKPTGKSRRKPDRYRLITIRMWDDDRFKNLSKPRPNAQSLWVYLLTGQHTTAFPGVFVSGEAGLSEALNWPFLPFRKALKEILDCGMAKYDRTHRLMFLPKAVLHNPPQSWNVVIAWRKVFNQLPDCELKAEIFKRTIDNMRELELGEGFIEAFGEAYEFPPGKPSTKPSPKPSGKTSSNQDSGYRNRIQEQEQEQDSVSPEDPIKHSKPTVPEEAVGRSKVTPEIMEKVWGAIFNQVQRNLGGCTPERFAEYWSPLKLLSLDHQCITVLCPYDPGDDKEWLERFLLAAAKEAGMDRGRRVRVAVLVPDEAAHA